MEKIIKLLSGLHDFKIMQDMLTFMNVQHFPLCVQRLKNYTVHKALSRFAQQ